MNDFLARWLQKIISSLVTQETGKILAKLTEIEGKVDKIMAGLTDINSAQTTLHADLVAENGLIKQLLAAFANQTLTSAQAQALVDAMNVDDADAKSNAALLTAALNPTTT